MTTSAIYYLGKPVVYPSENLIGRFLEAGQGWDVVLGKVLSALVDREDPVVVEVGSNIGASLVQIMAAKPLSRVLAFEPSNRYRPYLLRNIDFAEASERVAVFPYIVGKETGKTTLYHNASSASVVGPDYTADVSPGDSTFAQREEQPARMVTLDEELAGERVDFIKIDTDGFEFEVLMGAESILRDHKPVLFLELAAVYMADAVGGLSWLKEAGYERFLCLTPLGRSIGTTSEPEQAVSWANENQHGYCDVLACASGTESEGRLDHLGLD